MRGIGNRRRLFPIPCEGLIDHPSALTLPAAGYGMLLRLCLHFWATECEPLPINDDELQSIARAHKPTWRKWKAQILAVFDDVSPDMERYYLLRVQRKTHLSRLGQTAAGVKRLRAISNSDRSAPVISTPRKERPRSSFVPPLPPVEGTRKRRVDR